VTLRAGTTPDATPRRDASDAARPAEVARAPSLDDRAGEFLASVSWEGAAPDPAVVSAADFLDWL
jgi:hypothetical protein